MCKSHNKPDSLMDLAAQLEPLGIDTLRGSVLAFDADDEPVFDDDEWDMA
ncbi:MAG: hypothetical protein OXE99_13795 [Cellvibrionales bacterium]|nr:hypothetical protein [Cellvibrionales bacterium]